jgi:hypothetical protein
MLILQELVCVATVPTGWFRIQNEAYFRNRQERIRLEIQALKPTSVFPFNISNFYGEGRKQEG